MKKIISLLLAFIVLFSMNTVAFASSSSQVSSDGFYVVSENVPDGVYTHIQESIANMVSDLYDTNQISVSAPFKLSNSVNDLYYSLVYNNGKIVGTYRCFETDGHYTGIFSENPEIIDGFERISSLTSPDRPAKIVAGEHDDINAIIDSNIYTIFSDPLGNETASGMIQSISSKYVAAHTVNLIEGIPLKNASPKSSPSYKFLQIGWDETQGSKPWCMAYVTASIMRYKTGNGLSKISAQSVMQWAYPTLSQTELDATALSTSKADKFANTYNIDPVYTSSKRTYSQIVSEIKADNPVAFICDNLNTGAKKSHAFVCRGYDDNGGKSFYSVWNPWYEKFERIYTSDNTYVNSSGSARYLWSATTYSWE